MKKFESLGRSLSKREQKKVMGGLLPDDENLGGGCLKGDTHVRCNGCHSALCSSTGSPSTYSIWDDDCTHGC